MAGQPFAVFDIDGTLIRWQLFHAIVHSLGKYGYIPAAAHQHIREARAEWKKRTTDTGFATYEKVLVKEYIAALKGINTHSYQAVVQDVFEEYKDQTFTYTRDLVKRLKADGYVLIAISGSQHEIIEKLATHHGFDIAVGATLEQIDGAFSGHIDSPIFDKAKVLKDTLAASKLQTKGSYGVGDSMSDAPMLELVDNPIAFNPDRRFFEEAQTHGWKIVVERKNMIFELVRQADQYVMQSSTDLR
jgi:HAD superfamily hydrolase (TIGR01490 family)